MQTIRFYFDVISPFAWLAWRQIRPLCERHGVALDPRPVVFGALLAHHGQLGPAEIESKRRVTMETIWRRAHRHGWTVRGTARHPFNPVTALRLCLPEVAGERQDAVIDAVFDAGWQHGLDLSDPDVLANVLDGIGLDGASLVARTKEDGEVKAALRRNTDEAIAHGTFGVPTMVLEDGTLFWGDDSLVDLDDHLQGRDPVDPAMMAEWLGRPGDHRAR